MKIVQLSPSPLGFPFNLNFYQLPNFKNGYQNHYVPLKMGWGGVGDWHFEKVYAIPKLVLSSSCKHQSMSPQQFIWERLRTKKILLLNGQWWLPFDSTTSFLTMYWIIQRQPSQYCDYTKKCNSDPLT